MQQDAEKVEAIVRRTSLPEGTANCKLGIVVMLYVLLLLGGL